jgi:molybdopterin-guanine dinucleotide biosynthesis protein A
MDRLDGLVDEYVVVSAAGQTLPDTFASRPIASVEDLFPGTGPLGAVYTGLSSMHAPLAITVACDMPLLQPSLLRRLLRLAADHDAVVPVNDLPEPLCAVYKPACLPAIKAQIDAGSLKMTGFLDAVNVRYVTRDEWQRYDREGLSFLNLNRDEDLRRAEALLG